MMEFNRINRAKYFERIKKLDANIEKYIESVSTFQQNKNNVSVGVNLEVNTTDFLNRKGSELIEDDALKEFLWNMHFV